MSDLQLENDKKYIASLEKKLGIRKNSKLSCENFERRKLNFYRKIEKYEGISNNFMSLLDDIIPSKLEKNDSCLQGKKQLVKNKFYKKDSLSKEFSSLSQWRNSYYQKLQGLINRLSEGNMSLITENISETVRTAVYTGFHNKNFRNDFILELRKDSFYIPEDSGNMHTNRLVLIANVLESDLRELFIRNCIIKPQTTVSLVTVYSAVFCSVGILSSTDHFFTELLFLLNKIYNEKLDYLLKINKHGKSQIEIYNNKLILKHIVLSIISIYRCGFISGKILESFVSSGIDNYSSFKLDPFFWECNLDNVLSILRFSGFFIKEESNLIYRKIIDKLKKIIPSKNCPDSSFFDKLILNSSYGFSSHRLRFIVEELCDWVYCSQDILILQKLKRRYGLVERQLFTIHNWSVNFELTKHLQVIRRTVNSGIDDLVSVSYSNTLIDYSWRTDNFSTNCTNYLSPDRLKTIIRKLSSFYNINTFEDIPNISKYSNGLGNNNKDLIHKKLMNLASKIRLTSDIQKSIFFALMGSEDVYDAIQRITTLKIVKSSIYISSTVNVILLSAFSESTYNPFYYNVLKGLSELPSKISRKFDKEIARCFSQQLGLLSTFSTRKTIIISRLTKDCIFGELFNLRILKCVKISELHSIAGSIGLFFVELILGMIHEQKKMNDFQFLKKKFVVFSEVPQYKDILLLVIHSLILPALDSKVESNTDFSGITKTEILKFCQMLF